MVSRISTLIYFPGHYTSENCSVIPAAINTGNYGRNFPVTGRSCLESAPRSILVEYAKKGNKLVKVIRVTSRNVNRYSVYRIWIIRYVIFRNGIKMEVLHSCRCIYFSDHDSSSYFKNNRRSIIVCTGYLIVKVALDLVAGKAYVRIFKIVLPAAVPGILSGVILATGRIVGETAALIYTAGSVAKDSKQCIFIQEER